MGLAITGVLVWLRIDWGFEEWIHEASFYNFWNGVYFMLSGNLEKTETFCFQLFEFLVLTELACAISKQ